MNRYQVLTGTAVPFLRFESISSIMKMKAVGSSETSIRIYRTARLKVLKIFVFIKYPLFIRVL
jgi:hypothetical protein